MTLALDPDLERIVEVTHDLAFYRSVTDDGGLGKAACYELRWLVSRLPEGMDPEPDEPDPPPLSRRLFGFLGR